MAPARRASLPPPMRADKIQERLMLPRPFRWRLESRRADGRV